MARQLGLHVTGVLGVLLRGKTTGQVNSIKEELEALRTKARFFIAPDVMSRADRPLYGFLSHMAICAIMPVRGSGTAVLPAH